MSFAGKGMELEYIFLNEVSQTQKDMHCEFLLIKGILAKKLRIPKIQFSKLKKVNKLKGTTECASIPVERDKM